MSQGGGGREKEDGEEVWPYRKTLKGTNKGKSPVIYYITDRRHTNIGVISKIITITIRQKEK